MFEIEKDTIDIRVQDLGEAGCQQWWDSVVPEILSEVKVLWVLVEGGRSARKVNVENLQDVNDFLQEVKGKERTSLWRTLSL